MFLFYAGLSKRLSLRALFQDNGIWVKLFMFSPLCGMWLVSCLAETNRTPFDFAEGESELVSGFNVEYGASGFALIFIAEYARIFFMGCLFSFMFLSYRTRGPAASALIVCVVASWVWVRATLPRYRFDLLINLAWKIYLPRALFLLLYAGGTVV